MNAPCMLYIREWCGRSLQWRIVQDCCDPYKAPDVVFDDVTFTPLSYPISSSQQQLVQLLESWNHASSLAHFLELLVQLYMQHQKEKIAALGDERMLFELAMLDDLGCSEVLLAGTADGSPQQACFSIPVSVDLSPAQHLIDYLQAPAQASSRTEQPRSSTNSQHQQQQQFMLHVAFRVGPGSISSHAAPNLQLQSPQWCSEHLPGLSLPTWDPQSSLVEYVPHLAERMNKHLQDHCPAAALKFDLINSLADVLGPPLEVNMKVSKSSTSSSSTSGATGTGSTRGRSSSSAVFQLMFDQQPLLLYIDMSAAFPGDAPVLVLQSVRRLGPDSSVNLSNVPWSPRWAVDEMTARLFNFIKAEAPNVVKEGAL